MNEKQIIEAVKAGSGRVFGSGTRRRGDWSAQEHNGIISYLPDELTITVRAGTFMKEIEEKIAKHGQMLGFEPMDHSVIFKKKGMPTIGGALGVDADGPRRLRAGSMRDALLGVRFVDGQGQIIRAGGKVMKNVTGLDITRLFAGSFGTLGVALDVTMKLLPKPREQHIVSYNVPIAEAMDGLGKCMRMPLEITGAIYADDQFFIRQEASVVGPLKTRLKNELGKGETIDDTKWVELRDWKYLAQMPEIWRVYLRPSQVTKFLENIENPYMVLCGGSQIAIAGSLVDFQDQLREGMFARCEKGAVIGARFPKFTNAHLKLIEHTQKVFDPLNIFGGRDEN